MGSRSEGLLRRREDPVSATFLELELSLLVVSAATTLVLFLVAALDRTGVFAPGRPGAA